MSIRANVRYIYTFLWKKGNGRSGRYQNGETIDITHILYLLLERFHTFFLNVYLFVVLEFLGTGLLSGITEVYLSFVYRKTWEKIERNRGRREVPKLRNNWHDTFLYSLRERCHTFFKCLCISLSTNELNALFQFHFSLTSSPLHMFKSS
jgi:hypothetical protein